MLEILEETVHAALSDLSGLATKADLQALENRIIRELRSQTVWFFAILVAVFGLAFFLPKLLFAS